MKNLILLFVAVVLVGVNANGADKPMVFPDGSIVSPTGLEGIAKDGIKVGVEDYSNIDKEFDQKAISNQVKLRLVQAGIKVNEIGGGPYILINANPFDVGEKILGYSLSIEAKREVTFAANGKIYRAFGVAVWKKRGQTGRLRGAIDKYMDEFLLDYYKANPKQIDLFKAAPKTPEANPEKPKIKSLEDIFKEIEQEKKED